MSMRPDGPGVRDRRRGHVGLFTITGPQSPSVLSNMPVWIGQPVGYSRIIGELRERGATVIEPTVEADCVEHNQERAEASPFPRVDNGWEGRTISSSRQEVLA